MKKMLTGNSVKMIILEPKENSLDYKNSLVLKTLEAELGYTAAHSIVMYACESTGKSRSEILSNFETFSVIMKRVYGDVAEKEILDKLPYPKMDEIILKLR